MKESSIFDLRFGFYAKNYPCSQSPTSKIDYPGQNVRKFMLHKTSGSEKLATGRQPSGFSEISCGKSYTQIWILKGGTGGAPPQGTFFKNKSVWMAEFGPKKLESSSKTTYTF